MTLASLDHLPMPPPGPWMGELAALAASLSMTSAPCSAVSPHRRSRRAHQAVTSTAAAAARLQAVAARAYGVTPDEFRHILSTFPLVGREEKEAALEAFVRSSLTDEPVRSRGSSVIRAVQTESCGRRGSSNRMLDQSGYLSIGAFHVVDLSSLSRPARTAGAAAVLALALAAAPAVGPG